MNELDTLRAYRACINGGRFARVLDRGIRDLSSGKAISDRLRETIARQAVKNQHHGVFEFAARVRAYERPAQNTMSDFVSREREAHGHYREIDAAGRFRARVNGWFLPWVAGDIDPHGGVIDDFGDMVRQHRPAGWMQ